MPKLRTSPDMISVIIVSIIVIVLMFIPTGFPTNQHSDSVRAAGLVIDTNDAMMYSAGMIRLGDQVCKLEILNGPYKGQIVEGTNRLMGKMEIDKVFQRGDKALVVLETEGDTIRYVNVIDHYRIQVEMILFGAFLALLIWFAGWTGAKAMLSFVLTILTIWKILIPFLLKGWNPIILSMFAVVILTIVIITLVGGFNRKSLAAISGSLAGTVLTCAMAIIFGKYFRIHGAIMPFSETLLYAGYEYLNLTDIFIAATFIGSSGALMDIAIDIAAALDELVQKNPDLSRNEVIKSGFNIGRAVIGTMTTTLLLAYSGGYIALLMIFMAQGTPVANILNLKYVSAEILHTMVGSFGLVTVAPFTAIIAGVLFTAPRVESQFAKGIKRDEVQETRTSFEV
ncbi:putative membrane protein [Anaerosolibacter carboniphilus]|uniref:Putative membrane protein n=1 Tax=Anaerosolibacter carboniphilus TaxID=1417629 RepID=A0A841L043_9FIRM|nr:YibE/F family protein [Anaerosolibacter carboniphilus]MBB6218923.1 putative membrane protein [Anaerosolibacter carboniphilus]